MMGRTVAIARPTAYARSNHSLPDLYCLWSLADMARDMDMRKYNAKKELAMASFNPPRGKVIKGIISAEKPTIYETAKKTDKLFR